MTDNVVKIVVIGDIGVGKSSIIRRYVDNDYTPEYKISVQLDFKQKQVTPIPTKGGCAHQLVGCTNSNVCQQCSRFFEVVQPSYENETLSMNLFLERLFCRFSKEKRRLIFNCGMFPVMKGLEE